MSRKIASLIVILISLSTINSSIYASSVEGLEETTYDDHDWVIVVSDGILREDICDPYTYEKVFNPCTWENGLVLW